jgi:hypothetical protein
MMKDNDKNELIDKLKNDYVNFVKDTIQEMGELYPSFTIFCELKEKLDEETDEKALGMVHIPIPSSFMEDGDSKDELIAEVLPKIFKEIKKKFIPYALAWSSEVWVKKVSKDEAKTQEEAFKIAQEKVNKEEAVFINIQSTYDNEVLVYHIERNGKQINNEGDLVDKIDLIPSTDFGEGLASNKAVGGRFSGLFNKLNDVNYDDVG